MEKNVIKIYIALDSYRLFSTERLFNATQTEKSFQKKPKSKATWNLPVLRLPRQRRRISPGWQPPDLPTGSTVPSVVDDRGLARE